MELINGNYTFSGGLNVLEVCNKYECPVYIYDADIIKRQYDKLYNAFNVPKLRINYACKALTNINILKLMNNLGAGLDTVSIQEVMLGLHAGFRNKDIFFTPNCVSIEEIGKAVSLGVRINIDNLSILEQFGQLYPKYPVGIRINPHIMAGGNSKISTGHIDSKFGISFHQMPHVKRIIQATGLTIEGLHMHTGSEILDSEVFLIGAEILIGLAKDLPDLNYMDFGSGFKVPYYKGAVETDVEDLGVKISKRFNEFCDSYGKEVSLVFEPGKYLVSEAGFFFSKVNVVKQTTSTVFAGLDTGFNHLIRPMLYDAHHEIVNVSKPSGRHRIYTVVGYICETDSFGVNRKICEINEGDVLCMLNAGAYCFAMASNYNSRYRPAEVMIYEGKDYLIRKRENMEDIFKNQVEHDFFNTKLLHHEQNFELVNESTPHIINTELMRGKQKK